MSRIVNFLDFYEEDEWLRDQKLNVGYFTKKNLITGSTAMFEKRTDDQRECKPISIVMMLNYLSPNLVPALDPTGKTLAITVQMEPYPEAELPDLTIKNDMEKRFIKSFPQFAVYRQLAEFSGQYKIEPVETITGELIDFRDLTESDWLVAKSAYLLYAKLKMDVLDECSVVQLHPELTFF